ncbi:MAG: hypothetical protein ACE5JC_10080, partial [Candidatus Zixiibacteriota bacterium]
VLTRGRNKRLSNHKKTAPTTRATSFGKSPPPQVKRTNKYSKKIQKKKPFTDHVLARSVLRAALSLDISLAMG